MSKHIFAFLLLVLLVSLAGCRSEEAAQPTPTRYWTAREAYEKIRPTMLAWHEDAVGVYISSLSPRENPEQRVQEDGRSPIWSFTTISLQALKGTHIRISDGEVIVGDDGIPGNEGPISPEFQLSFTLEDVKIDSDEAVQIARENGGVRLDYTLIKAFIRHFNSRNDKIIPPSWELIYIPRNGDVHDVLGRKIVFIDVVTGEVLWSDFAE